MASGVNVEWEDYYRFLEDLRQSGVTNMFGATPYLQEEFALDKNEARDILCNWMENYEAVMTLIGGE